MWVSGPFQRVGYAWYQIPSGDRVSGVGYHTLPPGVEATAAVGKHPTGMLSCYWCLQDTRFRSGALGIQPTKDWFRGGVFPVSHLIRIDQHALRVVSQHALQVSRPIPNGKVEGSGLGGGSRPTTSGGSPGPHLGMSQGPHLGGGHFQAHTQEVSRPTPGGSPGPHQGISQHALRQTIPHPQQTATAAGGTHPTGMHSCWHVVLEGRGELCVYVS